LRQGQHQVMDIMTNSKDSQQRQARNKLWKKGGTQKRT